MVCDKYENLIPVIQSMTVDEDLEDWSLSIRQHRRLTETFECYVISMKISYSNT